jgi:endothelin-converting enzyme/putative endopeptidase
VTLARSIVRPALVPFVFAAAAAIAAEPTATPPKPAAVVPERPYTELPYTPSLGPDFMDRSVDPCVDFYAYSCGGWQRLNPIPPDQTRWSVYGKAYQENQRFLWGILEEAGKPAPGRSAERQKIGDAFAACMDVKAIDAKGLQPIEADLAAIDAIRSTSQIASLLGRLQRGYLGSDAFFGYGSNQDFGDSTSQIAFAYANGLGLPDRDYYLKEDAKSVEIREKYVAHVARTLELGGATPAAAKEGAAKVLKLETALAKASLTRVEKRDPHKIHHRMEVAELARSTPHFPWPDYLAALGAPKSGAVNVTEPAFFAALDGLLVSEPIADWRVYLRWHVLRDASEHLALPFRRADFDFYRKTLRGAEAMPPRWKTCVGRIDNDLGEALGKVFVEEVFPPETKAATVEMTEFVQQAMKERIEALDWMSAATKAKALEKLGTMRNKVGYPDKFRDYSMLQVFAGDYFGNLVRAAEFETRRQLAKIGAPIDRGEWGMTPPTVNAYYNPSMNDINFPAGVLVPPLYDAKLDDAPNYGNTGSTIGHELTHGFDDEGRKFDAAGNLVDWWTAEDAKAFTERAQCVVDQYAQYPVVDEVKINSRLTLGEDVADLGGTILAWEAWRKATANQKLEPRDGLSPEQRFFVGFAQWACSNVRAEDSRVRAATDPHSPPVWRINGVVANMPEFAEAFSCEQGQPMVREKVCRIW